MTYDECVAQCQGIAVMAEELKNRPGDLYARNLISACMVARPMQTGRFGNVKEKLSEVIVAAKAYQRAHIDCGSADDKLNRAVSKMRIALLIHKSQLN